MAKNEYMFEKDEKKSIVIAIIASIIVVVAVVLSFVAIKNYKNHNGQTSAISETTQAETDIQIEENSQILVLNQDELNVALLSKETKAILFQTDKEQTIVIPSGEYETISLIIDAPYTEFTNYGVFNNITINQIAANTWTESVSGNSLILDSASSHIIIPSGVTVKSIENIQADSTLAAEIQGKVDLFSMEAANSITSISVDGELKSAIMYCPTNLTLTGSRKEATPLEIEYGADGTVVTTLIRLDVTCFAKATVTFEAGAEKSTFMISASENTMTVENNTTEELVVTNQEGSTEKVAAGKNFLHEGVAQTSAATLGTTGTGDTTGNKTSTSGRSGTVGVSTGGSTVAPNTAANTSAVSSNNASASQAANQTATTKSTTTTSTTATSATAKYSETQVQNMVNSAVTKATSGMLTTEKANEMIKQAVDKAKTQAVDGMVSQHKATEIINEAVTKAIDNAFSQSVIVSFVNPAPVYAGEKATTLKTIDELGLPSKIEGITKSNTFIYLKVASWINEDGYSSTSGEGIYRFTAKIGDGYLIESGVNVPQVIVYVGATSQKHMTIFRDKRAEAYLSVTEYAAASNESCFLLQNKSEIKNDKLEVPAETSDTSGNATGESGEAGQIEDTQKVEALKKYSQVATYVGLEFYYLNADNKLTQLPSTTPTGRYLLPGDGWVTTQSYPENMPDRCLIVVDTYTKNYTLADSKVVMTAPNDGSKIDITKANTGWTYTECNVVVLSVDATGAVKNYDSFNTSKYDNGINKWTNNPYEIEYSVIGATKTYVFWTGGYILE